MFNGLSANTPIGKFAIVAGATLASFYSPIIPLLVACFVFTIADMFYGIRVSRKVYKQKLTSKRNWSGTIMKLLDEWTIISLARMLEFSVLKDPEEVFVLTSGATVVMCLTELWSILENLNTLNPNGPWRALGKFLKKKGENYIGTEIDLNDDDSSDNKVDADES